MYNTKFCKITQLKKEIANTSPLVEEQIEQKAKQVVDIVMKTSILEGQQPNNRAYELMLEKAKDSIFLNQLDEILKKLKS